MSTKICGPWQDANEGTEKLLSVDGKCVANWDHTLTHSGCVNTSLGPIEIKRRHHAERVLMLDGWTVIPERVKVGAWSEGNAGVWRRKLHGRSGLAVVARADGTWGVWVHVAATVKEVASCRFWSLDDARQAADAAAARWYDLEGGAFTAPKKVATG